MLFTATMDGVTMATCRAPRHSSDRPNGVEIHTLWARADPALPEGLHRQHSARRVITPDEQWLFSFGRGHPSRHPFRLSNAGLRQTRVRSILQQAKTASCSINRFKSGQTIIARLDQATPDDRADAG